MNFEQTEKGRAGSEKEPRQDSQFYPEKEIKKIKEAPKSERRERVEEFKEKLIEHRKGLARLQNKLFRKLEYNPDIPIKELVEVIMKEGDKFGINEEELEKSKEVLKRFARMRSQVKRWREKFPDDEDLYEELFGREPRGKISAHKGPVTLHFLCKNPEDYIWIVEGGWSEMEPSDHSKNLAKHSKGIKLGAPPRNKKALLDTITAEVMGRGADDYLVSEFYEKSMAPDGKATGGPHMHERQHARFKMLTGQQELRSRDGEMDFPDLIEALQKSSEEKGREYLHRHLQRFMRRSRYMIKNEVLAYLSENTDLDSVFKMLTKTKDKGGLYDRRRSYLVDHFARIIPEELEDPSYEEMVRDVAEEVLIGQYGEEVKEALGAVKKLINLGYSNNDIIALLTFEPLYRWKKFVIRLEEIESK